MKTQPIEVNAAFRAVFREFKKKSKLTYRMIEKETGISNAHLCLFHNGMVGLTPETMEKIKVFMDERS